MLLKCSHLLVFIIVYLSPTLFGQSPPRLSKSNSLNERKVVLPGSTATLECPVDKSPLDDLYFEWVKDENALEPYDGRIKIHHNGVLKIKSADSEDSGIYKCKAPPRLNKVLHPNLERPVKSTISFNCLATGHPEPTITWYHNNVQLTDSESSSELKKNRYSLVINDLKPDDSGNYTCIATNQHGSTNISYNLQVVGYLKNKPQVQQSYLENSTVLVGGMATLKCLVHSEGMPHIKWLKEISTNETTETKRIFEKSPKIKEQNQSYYVLQPSSVIESSPGFYLAKLIIYNAKESHSGKFACLAANSQGDYTFRNVHLKVLPLRIQQDAIPKPILIALIICIIISFFFVACCCFCYYRSKQNTTTHHMRSSFESPILKSNLRPSLDTYNNIRHPSYKPTNASSSQYSDLIQGTQVPSYQELVSNRTSSSFYHQYGRFSNFNPNLRLYQV